MQVAKYAHGVYLSSLMAVASLKQPPTRYETNSKSFFGK